MELFIQRQHAARFRASVMTILANLIPLVTLHMTVLGSTDMPECPETMPRP